MSGETSIDWEQVRKRLADLQSRAAQGLIISPDERKRILQERAHGLAQAQETSANRQRLLEVIEFELAGECYAFELDCVREICVLNDLTPVPCTPPFILGIINLRGEIHTVVDLKKFFDLPEQGITELGRVLMIEGGGIRLGILADVIRDVRTISPEDLHPSLPTLTGIRAQYLKGVTSDRLIVLDPEKILSDDAILVCDGTGS
jgi:purine-binding chemotaxis protein CheW